MSQNTVKIIIKSLAVLLGVIATFYMAFILCMSTVALTIDPGDPGNFFMLLLIPAILLLVYMIAVVNSVIKGYTNESIRKLFIVLCILLSFIIGHFFKHLMQNSNPPAITETACYLLVTLGIPYLTYRILNYLNYKYINSNKSASGNPAPQDISP